VPFSVVLVPFGILIFIPASTTGRAFTVITVAVEGKL